MAPATAQPEPTLESMRQQARLRVFLRVQVARASDEQTVPEAGKTVSKLGELAKRMSDADIKKSQVRNLENLAYTTDKVSDIADLLKKLIGRDNSRKTWANDRLGTALLAEFASLRGQADRIVRELPADLKESADTDLPRRVHLDLCREYARHLAAEFLYQKPGGT